LASKGVIKSGEAFCMSCSAGVEADAERCESCYSQLDQEVRAFRCPRCEKVLELGTAQCPECSMKFKVKTVRPSDDAEDDKMLARLIDWGRSSRETQPAPAHTEPAGSTALTPEETEAVSDLLNGMSELADLRAEVASSMGTRLSEARERISRLLEAGPSDLRVDDLESELTSISRDMERIDEVLTKMRAVSDDVSRTFSMPGPMALAGHRDISLKHPEPLGGGDLPAGGDLTEREEQVRTREEMVDRRIKAYALKKKELESLEASLSARPDAVQTRSGAEGRGQADDKRAAALAYKVRIIHELVSTDGACDDIEPCLASLEGHLRRLVVARSQLDQRVAQLNEGEAEVRRLMKTLDGLLGQLPTEAVERFSKSDEFKLYERVLDRLNV
jgi:hypothetical protein